MDLKKGMFYILVLVAMLIFCLSSIFKIINSYNNLFINQIEESKTENTHKYIINLESKKFHKISCSSAFWIDNKNKKIFIGSYKELIAQGYSPCKNCNP